MRWGCGGEGARWCGQGGCEGLDAEAEEGAGAEGAVGGCEELARFHDRIDSVSGKGDGMGLRLVSELDVRCAM